MFCKTIILSNSSIASNAPKGILTLSKENLQIKGKIRLYNLNYLPQNTKIGLYINEHVHTATIIKKPNHYEFDLPNSIDISQSIYCALIDNSNHDKKVLLEGGSFNGFYFSDSPFDAVLEAKDEQLEQEIDNALGCNEKCEACNCEDCEYKKFFYSHQNNSIISETDNLENINTSSISCQNDTIPKLNNTKHEQNTSLENEETPTDYKTDKQISDFEIDEKIAEFQDNVISKLEQEVKINNSVMLKENDAANEQNLPNTNNLNQTAFLDDIVYQLDELFDNYPLNETLDSIIPNSKFISVDGENSYVVGTIYEDNILKYIAYGVPASYNALPPADLGKHYQWLPLNPHDVMSDGYFMVFQDAQTGTLVEIEFEEQ